MPRPTRLLTACEWRDQMEHAIRRQVAHEQEADRILERPIDPANPFAEDRRNGRRAAELMYAEAEGGYARRCSDAFQDAARTEMVQPVSGDAA